MINLNAFGDDYVSFVAMHISFSPDGKYILVSTGGWMTDGEGSDGVKRVMCLNAALSRKIMVCSC